MLHDWISRYVPIAAAAFLVAGCATTTPQELKDARTAYTEASHGPAGTQAPAELRRAWLWLEAAEAQFEDDGNTVSVRDKAVIAARRAAIATQIALNRQYTNRLEDVRQQKLALSEQLDEKLAETRQELQKETAARIQAEARSQEALQRLEESANVSQEGRGLVINLSSGVLFETGKSDLISAASDKLGRVADFLKEVPDRRAVVEGHTDNVGSDERNEQLSIARAQSVKEFLVGRGVPSDRIETKGYGESRPVASNDSPTGRANNRRVEIVVEPVKAEGESQQRMQ